MCIPRPTKTAHPDILSDATVASQALKRLDNEGRHNTISIAQSCTTCQVVASSHKAIELLSRRPNMTGICSQGRAGDGDRDTGHKVEALDPEGCPLD